MRILRLALVLLLALAVPFQGFAAATRHAHGVPRAHHAMATAKAAAPHAAAQPTDLRPSTCCQPALLRTSAPPLARAARPWPPAFVSLPLSSWSEPVPRKPPRA